MPMDMTSAVCVKPRMVSFSLAANYVKAYSERRVDSRRIPVDFLDGFRNRDCAATDCRTCGYCEQIAAQVVSISPGYRGEILKKYAAVDDALVRGGLWNG